MYQSQRLSKLPNQLEVRKLRQTWQLHHGRSLMMNISNENNENRNVKEKKTREKVLHMDSKVVIF